MNLWALFLNHQGRVIHKWVHYFPVYERHFQRYVNRPITLIEIGCGEGGSLQLWKRYFGPYARIVGLDIRPECKNFEEDQIHVRIGDQSDEKFLSSVIGEFGPAQIIVDDGSHQMNHVATSFRSLYPRMAVDGVYMVEDLHTAYWDEYGGGLRRPESFVELCKDLIDELNAEHSRGVIIETDFSNTTLSMHFYDSIVVFERGKCGRKYAPQIGKAANPLDEELVQANKKVAQLQTSEIAYRDESARLLSQAAERKLQLEESLRLANDKVSSLTSAVESLNGRISSILASRSWQITAPLRVAHRWIIGR